MLLSAGVSVPLTTHLEAAEVVVLRSAAVLPAAGQRGGAVAEVHRQAPGDGARAHNWLLPVLLLLLLLLGWPL